MYINKRKTFGLILVSFLLGVFLGQYIPGIVYEFSPSGDKGAWFVKKCADLNGKELSYENLKALEGHVGLTEDTYEGNQFTSASYGYYPFKEEYFNQYLSSEYINDNSKRKIRNRKVIRVFDDNSFLVSENGGLEGNWKCRIKPGSTSSLMTTSPEFRPF